MSYVIVRCKKNRESEVKMHINDASTRFESQLELRNGNILENFVFPRERKEFVRSYVHSQ